MQNLAINQRTYTIYHPLSQEWTLSQDKNYIFDLSHLKNLRVGGEHARDFLQGQLSCDLREVHPQQMQQGIFCNLKGRILSLVDVVEWDAFHLILPQDLHEATLSSLKTLAMLSKIQLHSETSHHVIGFLKNTSNDRYPFDTPLPSSLHGVNAHEGYICYQLSERYYIYILETAAYEKLMSDFPLEQQRGSLVWHGLQLQEGHIEIYPETRGLFLPHQLGLHLKGYISFNKGCYKGQEIIARMHYRAKIKHTLNVFPHNITDTLQCGADLQDLNTQKSLGELVDFCPLNDQDTLVAVIGAMTDVT